MHIALNGFSAVRALRYARQLTPHVHLVASQLVSPDPGAGRTRWSKSLLKSAAAGLGPLDAEHPLELAVPYPEARIQSSFAKCTVYQGELSPNAFVTLDDGRLIAGPEMQFVEMARFMGLASLVIFGMELCGTFVRNPFDPRNGATVYWVDPVTSVERLGCFLQKTRNVRGLTEARYAFRWVENNAWAPLEALVATFAALPLVELGYGLGPIVLNRRVERDKSDHMLMSKSSRVPDLLFGETRVGVNYDGDGHMGLREIAETAVRAAMHPEEPRTRRDLMLAEREAREHIVDDKRRDRDLAARGYTVFAATKEDLYEKGGLDRLMTQVVRAVEHNAGVTLKDQRDFLQSKPIQRMRQELVWSLLPGERGRLLSLERAEREQRQLAQMKQALVQFNKPMGC